MWVKKKLSVTAVQFKFMQVRGGGVCVCGGGGGGDRKIRINMLSFLYLLIFQIF